MKRVLLLLLLFALPALARAALPAPVARALREAGIPPAAVAAWVQPVDARRPRLAHNAGAAMNPASVMKLVTTYAGLEILGPAYAWRTRALATGPVHEGVLEGNLHLVGSGDPKLTQEQFWLLLRQLRAQGVREIRGDLVLDRSLFDLPPFDPAAFDGRPLRAYNVAPDALLLAFKALQLRLSPDPERQAVRVDVEPQPEGVEVVNVLELAEGPCVPWRDAVGLDFASRGPDLRLVLTGRYPAGCGESSWSLSVMDHPGFVAAVFRALWADLGGRFAGEVREGAPAEGARPIAWIDSPPLADIVRDINKWSNNVMARQLFLTLGVEAGHRPAHEADGDAAIRAWLAAKDLEVPGLVLENGSGLSRRERISAAGLGRLLQAAYASPVMPEFISSLPVVAVDGTMRRRLAGAGVSGQAHIKGGSLEGVRAIAGYVLDRKGERSVVVFVVNHPRAGAAQAAQDALLQWVWERGR